MKKKKKVIIYYNYLNLREYTYISSSVEVCDICSRLLIPNGHIFRYG